MSAICTFFGHRDAPESIFPALKHQIQLLITDYSVTEFYFGGYGQFDHMALRAVRELQSVYPEISCSFVLAYLDRPPVNAERYHTLIFPESLECVPKRFAISHRNRWMVKNSDFIVCYIRNHYGGAFTAVSYAERQNKIILYL